MLIKHANRVAKIVHHNMGCGGIPIRPAPVPQPQARKLRTFWQLHNTGALPTSISTLVRPFSARLRAHTSLGLLPRRVRNCLVSSDHRPPTSPAHQLSSAARVDQLGVGSLFPAPGRNQDCSIHVGPGMREPSQCTAAPVGCASKQGQPVCQEFDSSSVLRTWICQVKISEHGIRFVTTLPPASLQMRAPALSTANPRRPKNPALVVAKNVERAATPTLMC